MAPTSRWRKAIRISAVSTLVLIAGVAASVPIQQHLLRWRAERLLADIHSLQMGKSTWIDAQKIMYRWGAWGSYEGSCTQARCSYQINLPDIFTRIQNHLPSECCFWMLRPYRFLGGRYSFALARVEVINGLVWGKDYSLMISVLASDDQDGFEYGLSASADTAWRTKYFHFIREPPHSEFEIGHPGACEGCKAVFVRFTPFADPQIVNSLMDFNFDCLTRRRPCTDQMDIMPSVWKKVLEEEKDSNDPRQVRGAANGRSLSPEFLGRDRENVVVAEIVNTRAMPDEWDNERFHVFFRLKQRLKRGEFWNVGEIKEAALPNRMKTQGNHAGDSLVLRGRDVILTLDSRPTGMSPDGVDRYIDLEPCDVIPLTNNNLLAVHRGISRDIFPAKRDVWP